MSVFLFMCSHGRTLQRPRKPYYIYVCGEKETERRRDTETNIEKGKGLHHIFAIIQHIMNNVCYRIAEIWYFKPVLLHKIVPCLCLVCCFWGFVTAPPDPPLLIPYELKPARLVLAVCVLGVVTALARPSPYMQGTNKYRFEEALQRLCNVPDAVLAWWAPAARHQSCPSRRFRLRLGTWRHWAIDKSHACTQGQCHWRWAPFRGAAVGGPWGGQWGGTVRLRSWAHGPTVPYGSCIQHEYIYIIYIYIYNLYIIYYIY